MINLLNVSIMILKISQCVHLRECDTLLQGSHAMIQKALHTFGKESIKAVAQGRKKNSGTIPVQSKSKSRRKFLIQGRGSSVKGRPTKDVPQASTQVNDVVYHSLPKQKRNKKKRPHKLTAIVDANVPSDKKH